VLFPLKLKLFWKLLSLIVDRSKTKCFFVVNFLFLRRFIIKDEFDDGQIATKCASFDTKIIKLDEFNEKYIKLNIWDTAGQEKYRALSKIFYKEASAAILVYDTTNKKSFEEIKDYWYNQVKECSQENTNKY